MRRVESGRPAWLRRAMLGAVLLVASVLGLAWVLGAYPATAVAAGGARAVDQAQGAGDEAFRLASRCRQAMLIGQCGAMKPAVSASSGPAASSPVETERVFVAGTGEVNAAVYAAWRQQGQAMCDDVEHQCRREPQGAACRLAKALYAGMP